MDRLFEIERAINGQSSQDRLAARQERSAPLVDELEALMLAHHSGLLRHDDLAKAMDYMLGRWPVFTRFLCDGRVGLTNNAAERAPRGHCPRSQGLAIRLLRPWWAASRLHV